MNDEERWNEITKRYIAVMKYLADGIDANCTMDDNDMHSVIDNVTIEFTRIKELLE